jgi:hypothetical protein
VFQRCHTRRCYERTRGLLFCALHFKALQRRDHSGQTGKDDDPDAASSADLGKVVNLMQGDSYAVAQRFWEFSGIFSSPVRLSIALYFLWQYVRLLLTTICASDVIFTEFLAGALCWV